MSVLEKGSSNDYLLDYRDGKILKGLGIGSTHLDTHVRFKRGQYNGLLGGSNTGKTYFATWYFLCLSSQYNLKWALWMDENSKGKVMRDLIQMYANKKYMDLTHEQILSFADIIENWFVFIDNMRSYTPAELLDTFLEIKPDGVFIDPFNQLDHDMTYTSNISFVRKLKRWCKTNDITAYLSMHPVTSSGRKTNEYPKGHQWEGQPMMPTKANAEGGLLFGNMCDDWINLHRFTKLNDWKYYTLIDIDKVKDTDTGGEQTSTNEPIMLFYNEGLGFLIDGRDYIKREPIETKKAIVPNDLF